MEANKTIKVYGTLQNRTLNPEIGDATHNDAIASAYLIYDANFEAAPLVENFQDNINKRVWAITYDNKVTTIENRDSSVGNPYMLIVKGNTNIGGNLHVDGDLTVEGDTNLHDTYIDGNLYVKINNQYQPVDLSLIIADIAKLKLDVNNIKGDVTNIQGDVTNIQGDITYLKGLWVLDSTNNRVVSSRPAVAAGFYDSTITQQ